MARVHIGTSGWSYKGWSGTFYPEGLGRSEWLDFYVGRFSTVEINATFYRLPSRSMVAGWNQRVPGSFCFAVKGSRRVTHVKKLVEVEDDVSEFVQRMSGLDPHLGPILWQLPPLMPRDLPRLDRFLTLLPEHLRHAVEFRHPSWLDDEVAALLRAHGAAQVAVSSLKMPADLTVTADFTYLRFHGLDGDHAHDYSRAELQPWAEHVRRCRGDGIDVYAYFNNDGDTRAPANARLLLDMIGSRG